MWICIVKSGFGIPWILPDPRLRQTPIAQLFQPFRANRRIAPLPTMINYPNDAELLRSEIAAAAARMIAEDGADYGSAKRKAAKLILGNNKVSGD
eukprot:gene58506-78044_t